MAVTVDKILAGVLMHRHKTADLTPAGSDTQVQFNDGGVFGADADFTFDRSTALKVLTVSSVINALNIRRHIMFTYFT